MPQMHLMNIYTYCWVIFSKLGVSGKFLKRIKYVFVNLKPTVLLNQKTQKSFPLKS